MSRLRAIVARFGGVVLDGGASALIPGPGHSAKDRSVSLRETEDGRILIHCFSPRDDWREVRDALVAEGLLEAEPRAKLETRPSRLVALQPVREDKRARAARWWREARPIAGTVAERYLRTRGVDDGGGDRAVFRYHASMSSLEDTQRRPALLAAIQGNDRELCGVQVTLLSTHGAGKANLATPRRVIGQLMGGAVRIDQVASTLAVGEGVETMLAARAYLAAPVWALLSAENLARFDPPEEVETLIIAHDNDDAGLHALERLSRRLSPRMAIVPQPPPSSFNDWSDWSDAARF
ncbi:DUF7146 domain-containing protein [Vitreimonas flagellata]|uniref:DUF7146 domain-containing protein n=1 Tax=Vitreimonas flagellata TaxID=2560861 RepID=UPI001074B034|nr:toprim domain-containing protein [Vitreimonas flagellata]